MFEVCHFVPQGNTWHFLGANASVPFTVDYCTVGVSSSVGAKVTSASRAERKVALLSSKTLQRKARMIIKRFRLREVVDDSRLHIVDQRLA